MGYVFLALLVWWACGSGGVPVGLLGLLVWWVWWCARGSAGPVGLVGFLGVD